MCKRIDPMTKAKVLVPQEWIKNLAPSRLLNLMRIPHLGNSPELNVVVKVLLPCVHDGYLWLDRKIDLNVDAIHRITGMSNVGADLASHFMGKNLDRKLVVKLTKEFNLSKGRRSYDVTDIQDEALRFTVQLLVGQVLRKCGPNEVPAIAIELATQEKDGQAYN